MKAEILIIDDNPDIRTILKDLIDDAGFKTRVAANYNQALMEIDKQLPDVAIIDVPWNGILESVKIAAMAEPYEINVAPHNFYGHLSTLMSAHFCAVLPHLRIMEIDPDDVPWKDDLVTVPPVIENGVLKLPTGPGWGADPDEDAIRAHPPKGGWRG